MSEPARVSFRDPDGYLVRSGARLFRCVAPHAAAKTLRFLRSPLAARWMEQGTLCATRESSTEGWTLPEGTLLLDHQPVSFPSYPYEWSPGMLAAAGELTLDLAEAAVPAGYCLKDATPYNILFEGARPVFVDLLSFDEREPTGALWRSYAQFMRTFVYPLLLQRSFGLRLDETLTAHRDGLEPERVRAICPWWRLALPPFLGAVTLPSLLGGGGGAGRGYQTRHARSAEEAAYVLSRVFRRARKLLLTKPPRRRPAPREPGVREKVIREALAKYRPTTALDVGCHTSRMAAEAGARVVAIDPDVDSVDALWREARAHDLPILPLAVDIARPSGAAGWENAECPSFLDRAAGAFECVLMLPEAPHLIVNERVPLRRIFSLAARLTTDLAILEYVDPRDPRFQQIVRGREALHADLTEAAFERAAADHFDVAESVAVTPFRRIYTLRKRC